MTASELMLGNEAMARGLLEAGCRVATSYPGTPASEILAAVADLKRRHDLTAHVQWAVNEKVAFEIAYAAAMSGLRAAVSMKQVGLNVASDPLMSAAYLGNTGGFIVISADDPGPHSSQTEQDSRMMAMMAKIPVLDPVSPAHARDLMPVAYALSEAFEVPVMLRPTTRICHSRQDVAPGEFPRTAPSPDFRKDPKRWAATPKFRLRLHKALEEKLAAIAAHAPTAPVRRHPGSGNGAAVIASGVAAAHVAEILEEGDLAGKMAFYQVVQPFPLHAAFIEEVLATHDRILVIEETMPVIEMQLADRNRVFGKLNGQVPRVGELLPERILEILQTFAGETPEVPSLSEAPGRRPTLCAGCPHRASFHAVKRAAPKGIYTSDIGCYTLGLNLGAVDTVLCMGAAISQAAGFYHAYKHETKRPDIVATMGDSTFFHAGVPALIDAVVQNVRFVLVILDNRTTAMTGNQPTPATGLGATGEPLNALALEPLIRGCGVQYLKTGDPYDYPAFVSLLKEAVKYSRDTGPAVVISRHPCLLDRRNRSSAERPARFTVNDDCDGCGYCIDHFECPALIPGDTTRIDPMLCTGCGVCQYICPKKAIEEKS